MINKKLVYVTNEGRLVFTREFLDKYDVYNWDYLVDVKYSKRFLNLKFCSYTEHPHLLMETDKKIQKRIRLSTLLDKEAPKSPKKTVDLAFKVDEKDYLFFKVRIDLMPLLSAPKKMKKAA